MLEEVVLAVKEGGAGAEEGEGPESTDQETVLADCDPQPMDARVHDR